MTEALTAFEASGRGDMLTEAYRLQGELLLRQVVPAVARVEACFEQALAIARSQQAKSWELRAAISLSQLWQQQGKRDEARELLAPIYGWFTEGFDTADLQEAKALLEALSWIGPSPLMVAPTVGQRPWPSARRGWLWRSRRRMQAFCPQCPLARPPRGGQFDAGTAAHHHPAGDDARRGH